jgi:hypothetical protein
MFKARKLEKLNISDSAMGSDAVLLVVRAIKESAVAESLKEFYCNYNEAESSKVCEEALSILVELPAI